MIYFADLGEKYFLIVFATYYFYDKKIKVVTYYF